MAATVPNGARVTKLSVIAALLMALISSRPLLADRAADMLGQISTVANALTSGDAAAAMAPFDKSYVDYDKLSGYFQALTGAQIENEVDVTDERDSDSETKLTVNWTLTLTDLSTNRTARRTADINVRIVKERGKWKIVEFSPIAIFNPLQNQDSKQ